MIAIDIILSLNLICLVLCENINCLLLLISQGYEGMHGLGLDVLYCFLLYLLLILLFADTALEYFSHLALSKLILLLKICLLTLNKLVCLILLNSSKFFFEGL